MPENFMEILKKIGLSEKAAKIYLAALENGESTIQQLAKTSGLKRTTIYYVIAELLETGALIEARHKKKIYYLAEPPQAMLRRTKENIQEFEEFLPALEQRRFLKEKRVDALFLRGASGFKQIWEKIFESGKKEYKIITDGTSFLNVVKEKYVVEEIIKTKNKLGIHSRQLISDSVYARKIIAKDAKENRVSKILPAQYKLPYTVIICGDLVAFIALNWESVMILIKSADFAQTQRSIFDVLWNALP